MYAKKVADRGIIAFFSRHFCLRNSIAAQLRKAKMVLPWLIAGGASLLVGFGAKFINDKTDWFLDEASSVRACVTDNAHKVTDGALMSLTAARAVQLPLRGALMSVSYRV